MGTPQQQTPAAGKGTSEEIEQFDAIVIGAGVTGLYALYSLRQHGLSVRIRESFKHRESSGVPVEAEQYGVSKALCSLLSVRAG